MFALARKERQPKVEPAQEIQKQWDIENPKMFKFYWRSLVSNRTLFRPRSFSKPVRPERGPFPGPDLRAPTIHTEAAEPSKGKHNRKQETNSKYFDKADDWASLEPASE